MPEPLRPLPAPAGCPPYLLHPAERGDENSGITEAPLAWGCGNPDWKTSATRGSLVALLLGMTEAPLARSLGHFFSGASFFFSLPAMNGLQGLACTRPLGSFHTTLNWPLAWISPMNTGFQR